MKKDQSEKALQEQRRQALIAKTDPAIVAAIEKKIAAMDRYVNHLLRDFEKSANNLPDLTALITSKDLPKGLEWTAEISNSPYKTIEEWTGIQLEELPDESYLTGDQIERLVEGLDELWSAWYWVFDIEEGLQEPVIRYRMYLDCWTDTVQYLPNLGFDIPICNGDPESCRMGEACICLTDPPDIESDEPPFNVTDMEEDGELPF